MVDPVVVCPRCRSEIKLTESLAAPLVEATRRQYEQLLADKEADVSRREGALRERQSALGRAEAAVEERVASRLQAARTQIAAEEAKRARAAASADLEEKGRIIEELQSVVQARDAKLAAAQQAQAELMRKQRELDDARRELELTVEQRVEASLRAAREAARKEAEEGLRLTLEERQETIASMKRQIEELRRKAEQGSQQLQGEVLELELEATLRARFPQDSIEPVPKGEHGGDVLQRVAGPLGHACGAILWESKRTKHWSDGWLPKLRDDQRAAQCELSVLVSQVLPKGVDAFDLVDGVWVVHPRASLPLAAVLRQTLIEVSAARRAGEGQQTKMEIAYQYLTGPRFRQRVQAIVEAFTVMQEDLERERRALTRQWEKRREQLDRMMNATVGMYGDLQGIAGRSLKEIAGLDLPLLDAVAGAGGG